MIGGEGPANGEWLAIDTAIMIYAQIFNALVVQVEHRFYGETHPLPDLSDESLQYLSSEQVSNCHPRAYLPPLPIVFLDV